MPYRFDNALKRVMAFGLFVGINIFVCLPNKWMSNTCKNGFAMPEISERAERMPASPIRKLVPYAVKARERGIRIYSLNIGQPDIETPQEGLDALKHIDRKVLEYSPSDGLPSYRSKLVGYYTKFGIDISPEDIIVTTGGSEALQLAFPSCINPGDDIIITEPTYANYISFAMQAGVKVKPIKTDIRNGYALPDIEDFEALIDEKTKAILICNPNNPTGYVYTKDEMMRIRDIVKKHDLFLFSDEVYREFRYTDAEYVSALHLKGIEDNVVLIDSVSKRYSECGIRIGAVITRNRKLRDAMMKFAQARLSPPLLGQIVAEASLDAPQSYLDGIYEEYIERRNLLVEGLNKIPGVYSPMPNGAFYTMAQLPIDDCDRFCEWLLRDFAYEGETVMFAPGSGFYSNPADGRDKVRMAYVLKKEDLARSLVILEKALEIYPGRTTR